MDRRTNFFEGRARSVISLAGLRIQRQTKPMDTALVKKELQKLQITMFLIPVLVLLHLAALTILPFSLQLDVRGADMITHAVFPSAGWQRCH